MMNGSATPAVVGCRSADHGEIVQTALVIRPCRVLTCAVLMFYLESNTNLIPSRWSQGSHL